MKIRFESLEHKLQIRMTLEMILSNPEFTMSKKDAEIFGEIGFMALSSVVIRGY